MIMYPNQDHYNTMFKFTYTQVRVVAQKSLVLKHGRHLTSVVLFGYSIKR